MIFKVFFCAMLERFWKCEEAPESSLMHTVEMIGHCIIRVHFTFLSYYAIKDFKITCVELNVFFIVRCYGKNLKEVVQSDIFMMALIRITFIP